MTPGDGRNHEDHLISVIMPTFNAAGYISDAVHSVLSQEGAGLELVVQDGGSRDDTLSILEATDDPRISVDSRPDHGLGEALNRAISRANGDWIVWLNADDLLTPGAIEAVAPFLSGTAEILCGDFAQIDADGEQRKLYLASALDRRRLFRRGAYVFMGGTLVKRDVFDRVGGFDEDLHFCADWDFCVRAADQVESVHVSSCLAGYRFHPGSLSVKNPWRFFPEGIRVVRRHATGPRDLAAGFLCLARIALYVATRPLWTSRAWRRLAPSSKRL